MITIKEKNFVSAVLYLHQCEKNISFFLKRLNKILSENFEKYEIICVNDCCTDNTIEKVKDIAKTLSDSVLSVVNMSFFQGLELSMNAGIDLAIGDFVFEFDNIFIDYDDEVIMQIYHQSLKGYDIVSAASSQKKRFSSRAFYYLFNRNANTQYKLATETFRVLSRRAINRVHSMSKTIPYRKALYANCGLKVFAFTYSPIKETNSTKVLKQRKQRQSLAFDSLILFTDIAYKMSLIMTFVMMSATVVTAIYALYVFLKEQPIAGWTTTILFLSFAFFGIFAILAIVIKYLSLLVDLVFKKQQYIVESIDKINK